ncbi:MAG: hypothetical protein ABI947_12900 [Chloroflexota bacterium]
MPRIPDQLLNSIVYFYPNVEAAERGTPAGGTGFLVDFRSQSSEQEYRYVITNSHVIRSGGVFLRFNVVDGGTNVKEIPQSNWVHHYDSDDICAAILEKDAGWSATALQWDNIAATIPRMNELNMGVGDEVFMLGRFISHSGVQRNQPLARFGNIAMMPGERVLDGRQLRVEAFLVEMRSLAGFSGSPVFVYMGPGTYRGDGRMMPFYSETISLIGIDTGHKLLTSTVTDKATRTRVNDNWVVEQDTGISIVSPVWKIRQVLDDEDFVKQRKTSSHSS